MKRITILSKCKYISILLIIVAFICCLASCSYEADNGLQYKRVKGGYEVTGYIGTEKDIVIPSEANGKAVVGIAAEAFSEIDIRSLVVPDTVTYIGEKAFYKCKNLANIELGKGLTSIGDNAFEGCQIEKMNSTGTMEDWFKLEGANWRTMYADYFTFQGAKVSKELVIPNFVKEIPDYAFEGVPITSLVLSDSVESVGTWAFNHCEYLESITFGKGLKTIGHWGFGHCALKGHISIPESVEHIKENAFGYSSQSGAEITIYIPKGVEKIDAYAFGEGFAEVKIYCEEETEPFGWDAKWAFYKDNVVWGATEDSIE